MNEELQTKAAIYLEEMGVSGDTMVAIDDEDRPQGSYYLYDLLAGFVEGIQSGTK